MFRFPRAGLSGFAVMAAWLAIGCGITKPLEPPGGAGGGNGGSNGRGISPGSAGADGGASQPPTSSNGGSAGAGAGGAAPLGTNGWTMPAGPTFSCGPTGSGLLCSCGSQPFFPAPPGSTAGLLSLPGLADGVGYRTIEELDALVVGRWVRIAGAGELSCEQYGLDFTSDHQIIPLVIASDGSVQPVPASRRSFTIDFTSGGTIPALVAGSLTTNAPLFTSGPDSFYFAFSPWVALYERVR